MDKMDRQSSPKGPEEQSPGEEEALVRIGADLFDCLQMVLGCILAAVFLFNCVLRLTRVDGQSMDPTLQHGELMVVWSLGCDPGPGDIVVLNKTTAEWLGGEGGEAIVKRVIAVGGQTVDIDYSSSTVYVDGQPLSEPYINGEMYLPGSSNMQETHWEVPEGSYFVMGDNRNHSTDSRHAMLGTIDKGYLLGKVVLAIWPPSKFGLL